RGLEVVPRGFVEVLRVGIEVVEHALDRAVHQDLGLNRVDIGLLDLLQDLDEAVDVAVEVGGSGSAAAADPPADGEERGQESGQGKVSTDQESSGRPG